MSRVGLTPHNYNYLKCWFTLIYDGREVFQYIFTWGFQKPAREIKEALFQLPSYSSSRFRSDFDLSQRRKLEKGDVSDFDLNLLYLLLQRLCKLPCLSDPAWGRDGDPDILPNILYQIKMKRNALAHTNIEITEVEMLNEIDKLKCLFNKALNLAAVLYDIPENDLKDAKQVINLHILSVQGSNVAITQENLKKVAEEKFNLARNEAMSDLISSYKHISKVLLAPWTVAESFRHIKDVFTEPLIRQTTSNILSQQLTEEESIVTVENILRPVLPDGTQPNFILILSPSGMGKTTLVKYIIQSWIERSVHIATLDSVDLVLYLDCRETKCRSFEDFISFLMPNTLQFFSKHDLKILIMTMQVLVILDNIDEIKEDTLPTYEDLLNRNSDAFRIIATSAQSLPRAVNKKCHQKVLKLQLEGICHSKISSCISKMYTSLYGSEKATADNEEMQMFVSEFISKAHLHSSETVRSPEILSHVFFQWLMQSKNESFYTTKSQLFFTTHELLCLKLLEKAGATTQTRLLDQKIIYDKINLFFDEIFRTAHKILKINEVELSSTTFNELIEICKSLELPYSILKEVFVIKEKKNHFSLGNLVCVTFPSKSLQIFYCAMHITNLLSSDDECSLDSLGDEFLTNLLKINGFNLFIKFVIGILALRNIGELERNLSAIFSTITKYCPNISSGFWLEICEETRCHATVMKKVRKEMGDSWALEDQEISAALITMLYNHPHPKHLTLTCLNPPEDTYFLKKVLENNSFWSDISVTLHLYQNFWVNKKQLCDSYLSIVLKNKINIESFAGKLSSEQILRIPHSLKRLALHIKPEDITILNSSLEKLDNLMMLYLNLDITFDFPGNRVPRLRLPSSNILLYLDLWSIGDQNIEWCSDTVAAFSPAYSRLALRKTTLDYDSSKLLLEGLRNRRVHMDSLLIGSKKTFSEEDETSLSDFAFSFECYEVKIVKL